MANQALHDEAARALDALSARARADFLTLWETAGDQASAIRLVREYFPALVERYGTITASMAGDVFSTAAAEMGVPANVRVVQPDLAEAAARGGWAVGTDNPLGNLKVLLDELVKQPYRSTMAASAHASGIAWARVPRGPAPCAFCRMLASRGAVYRSQQTALMPKWGDRYHGDCFCRVIPVRGPADYPADYNPDALLRDYKDARDRADSSDPHEILAELRKHYHSH